MKQYLLSIYQPEGDPPPPAVLDRIMRDAVEDEMKEAGVWVFSGGLHPPEHGHRCPGRGGRVAHD